MPRYTQLGWVRVSGFALQGVDIDEHIGAAAGYHHRRALHVDSRGYHAEWEQARYVEQDHGAEGVEAGGCFEAVHFTSGCLEEDGEALDVYRGVRAEIGGVAHGLGCGPLGIGRGAEIGGNSEAGEDKQDH